MDSKTAYITFYEILSQYYFETARHYDQLGSMLGDLTPSEFGDDREFGSLDRAVFDDWSMAWDDFIGKGEEGAPEQVLRVAKVILDYYALEVEYELGDAEGYLREHLGA